MEAVPVKIVGYPLRERICTSHIERQNLSIRMGMRRMTRLTNAFSRKWENVEATYALWFAYYNWCRVHKSLRITPDLPLISQPLITGVSRFWFGFETNS